MGRKIILFSDGTGNSAGKITKTNVWRLYQAVDLTDPDTIAFHDDGVGSGGSRLIKVLGGAVGIGLARNVRHLYEQLCRHYEGDGDEIHLCGFSRGAFTVRVLSGLIDKYGVIDRRADQTIDIPRWHRLSKRQVPLATDEGLKAAVRMAYATVRRESSRATLWRLVNRLGRLFGVKRMQSEDFRRAYSVKHDVRIKFIGVFETVSAYGLPFDEMAIAIHKYLFPLRFPDMNLSKKVDNAVQALAVDEARHSFHPVMWTEWPWNRKTKENILDPRPLQVWFPGVHSDIGGGYADERLSLVPALWMAEELRKRTNITFRDAAISELRERATKLGEMHDSRGGLGASYRFKPRIFEHLGHEDMDGNGYAEVQVRRFKIHRSVFERIRATGADYAPLGIPEDYDVVREIEGHDGMNTCEIASADAAGFENAQQRATRVQAMRRVKDVIFWRQVLYYVMTGIAVTAIALPLLWLTDRAAISTGVLSDAVSILAKGLAYLPLPETERIGLFWIQHAGWFWVLFAGFWLAYFLSAALARTTLRRAQGAWSHLAGMSAPKVSPRPQWVEFWRQGSGLWHRWWTKKVFPLLMVIFLVFILPTIPIWRWYLFTPLDGQSVCAKVAPTQTEEPVLRTNDPCLNTGIELKEGRDYKISIEIIEPWRDGKSERRSAEGTGLPAGPHGLDWESLTFGERATMTTATLMRRYLSEDWMALMGSIGRDREHAFRIDAVSKAEGGTEFEYTFHAWRSGRLYLFVNDAINVRDDGNWCSTGSFDPNHPWACYYNNNQGAATFSVEEVGER